jgi:hypothetical protein
VRRRSERPCHLHLVDLDGMKVCCRRYRERASKDPAEPVMAVNAADDYVTKWLGRCPICRDMIVVRTSPRPWSNLPPEASALPEVPPEAHPSTRYAAAASKPPRRRSRWDSEWFGGLLVLLLLWAAVMIGHACGTRVGLAFW